MGLHVLVQFDISGKVGVSTLCENKKIIPLHILIGLSLKSSISEGLGLYGRHISAYEPLCICTNMHFTGINI